MEPWYKEKAIKLRRWGHSYSEILDQVPVAKSTLSLWLHSVNLSKNQKQKLTEKKLLAALRGAQARKDYRLEATMRIFERCKKDLRSVSKRELWLIGIILYWAEGSKEKEEHVGSGVQFTNSDPLMLRLFAVWLTQIMNVARKNIYFDIFIHENKSTEIKRVKKYWSGATGFPEVSFPHVYFKKHNPKTLRKNTGSNYFGLLKLRVRRSSILNRQIAGWVKAVVNCVQIAGWCNW